MRLQTLFYSAFFLTALCSSITGSAQTHYSSRVYFGAHGGADLSRVTFTPGVTQGFNAGFNAGLNFRYVEENHFGFIVELNYVQRGWKEDFEGLPYRYSRTADFIELPFLSHIYFGSRGKFYINAGPSISVFVGERTNTNIDVSKVGANPDFITRITYQWLQDVSQKFDYGIQGGIGGEFSINRSNSIYLDARFYYGLGNLLKSGRNEPIRGSNSMTISISAGYWFRVK